MTPRHRDSGDATPTRSRFRRHSGHRT